jgi:hypothetical protein
VTLRLAFQIVASDLLDQCRPSDAQSFRRTLHNAVGFSECILDDPLFDMREMLPEVEAISR